MANVNPINVSIIIPTYNKALYIQEAVESALAQTYKNVEIIVVDDGSTDGTTKILESYIETKKITYFYQPNKGHSAARNAGLRMAKGRYIKFLDSDDFLYPQQIEKQIQDIAEDPKAISVTDCTLLKLNGKIEIGKIFMPSPQKQYASFIESNKVVIHAVLVPKFWLEQVGGFDETLTCSVDTDLWIRILGCGAYMKHLPFAGCCYRILRKSVSDDTENMFFQKVKIYEKINQSFKINGISDPFLIESLLNINTKLLEECLVRKLNPAELLVNTLEMTGKLYDFRKKGIFKMLYKMSGISNYLRVRHLIKCMTQKNYRFDLLHHNYNWKHS